jgi:hypothetical protein
MVRPVKLATGGRVRHVPPWIKIPKNPEFEGKANDWVMGDRARTLTGRPRDRTVDLVGNTVP